MDDPDGQDDDHDTFDRVFSPDRRRIATWTVASHEIERDEERCLYEVSVRDAASGRRILHVTRRWRLDRHTNAASGSPLVGVFFAPSGALLLLAFADGGREAVPLPAGDGSAPRADAFVEDATEATLFVAAEPCSICGAAAWSQDVCDSCARYCEKLLVTGGLRPTLAQVMEEERARSAHPDPSCSFCGTRGVLAVSGPFGHACQACVHRVRAPR